MKITKDMKLADVVKKYPATIEIFISFGLHCIGCPMASAESIENGAMSHGITGKNFEKMMAALNAAV